MDSNGNILSAITHGHQTETYIYWINSMFGGYKGWYGNTSATSVTIPDTRTIAYGAFYNCNSLTDIVIPDSLTEIASSAFYECTSLTSIVIPDAVKKIGSEAFRNCSGLKEVTLPISAEYNISGYYSGSSFSGCSNVKKITYTVGDGTVFAYGNAYTCALPYYASGALTTVVYEEGITEIPEHALHYCSRLTSVTLPSTVKKIGTCAFYGCSALKDISITRNIEAIGASAFRGCGSITAADISSLTEIAYDTFYECTSLTSIVIPDAVKKIGSEAFRNCSGLKEVTLPISAEYNISGYYSGSSFSGCSNVKKITYTVGDGTVFAYGNAYTCALPYYASGALTTVVYEEGITEIPEHALHYCSRLTSVTLPSTVKKIGNYAFYGCSGLRSAYYNGGRNDWNAIAIGANNDSLLAAKLYFLVAGDINGSGAEPDASDLQCLYTYLSKREAVGAYQDDLDLFLSMADVNGDGAVNILDYQRLYMALTGAAPLR